MISFLNGNLLMIIWSFDQTNWVLDFRLVYLVDKGGKSKTFDAGATLLEQVASEIYRSSQGWKLGVFYC